MTRRATGFPGLRDAIAAAIAVGTLFAGCSSVQPTRYHSLMPAVVPDAPEQLPAAQMAWEVLPVAIPAQVDQPQWVVRMADGSLALLEQERWIAPLGEEFRAAVSERLTRLLGAPSLVAEPGKRWRIRIDVQRLDSGPGRETRLEATWTVLSDANAGPALRCRGLYVEAIGSVGDYPAIAKGHQQGVARLADEVGGALMALSRGQPASCKA
jgi:uncharacterized lipoprotein YmbA